MRHNDSSINETDGKRWKLTARTKEFSKLTRLEGLLKWEIWGHCAPSDPTAQAGRQDSVPAAKHAATARAAVSTRRMRQPSETNCQPAASASASSPRAKP